MNKMTCIMSACLFASLQVAHAALGEKLTITISQDDLVAAARKKQGMPNIPFCALHGVIEGIQTSIDAGNDINDKAPEDHESYPGYTALHIAVHKNWVEGVKFLLANGAQPFLTTGDGKTPLMIAQEQKHTEIETILSEYMAFIRGYVAHKQLSTNT